MTGFPGEAEIRYYVKVTVNRPSLFKENPRAITWPLRQDEFVNKHTNITNINGSSSAHNTRWTLTKSGYSHRQPRSTFEGSHEEHERAY